MQRPDVGEPGRRLVGRAGAAAQHDDSVVALGRTRHLATGLRPDRHHLGPGGPDLLADQPDPGIGLVLDDQDARHPSPHRATLRSQPG